MVFGAGIGEGGSQEGEILRKCCIPKSSPGLGLGAIGVSNGS